MRLHTMFLAALIMALMTCGNLSGQDRERKETPAPSHRIPGLAGRHLNALGKRMNSVGREKTTYKGQLFGRSNNPTAVRVTHDVSSRVRLEGFRADEILSFDGKQIKGTAGGRRIKGEAETRADEDLMEVFVMDSVEGMMESLRQGAAVQYLGGGIGPDPQLDPSNNTPRYDVYEVAMPVRCRRDKRMRIKTYFFDSATGLLALTRYSDDSGKSPVAHETRYTVWGDIDGSKYAARVEHYVDGRLQFDFITEDIRNEESVDKSEY